MNTEIEALSNEQLMAEVRRRGLLSELHGAAGALYDHLATTGALDGGSEMTSYLAYRLRREEAKLGTEGGSGGAFWDQKIAALEASGSEAQAEAA